MKRQIIRSVGFVCLGISIFLIIGNIQDETKTIKHAQQILKQEIIDEEYLGILELPTIDVKSPIYKDYSEENLKLSPCLYLNNPLIIAGHNYASSFGKLKYLKVNDPITLVTNDTTYIYKVSEIETLSRFDVEKMENTSANLTLFTCTPGGSNRVVIRCALVQKNSEIIP